MVTLQTERLTIYPCTATDVTRLQQQQYENGPEVQHHLTLIASDPSMLYWGSWLVMTKDGQVVGDIGFKGNQTRDKQSKSVMVCYQRFSIEVLRRKPSEP